ncbi:MAG: (E)-4-hydroxy-3-methylbut-2-enyl-diphosphate synthase [Bacteroidota bacterium]|nr:(E)-4-hydroxy-3-methylbut-2-enyl-diphosphate synthase [Bacteroidota bacterium]
MGKENNAKHIVTRRLSKEVRVGNIVIGGNNPIVVQSMTNTDTLNTQATVEQTKRLVDCGCQMVRITASEEKTANNLYNIKNSLIKQGYQVPLVADIHFNPKAAEISASLVEKIRINPGNYVDKHWEENFNETQYKDILKKAQDNIFPLVDICKKYSTAIRIGVNHGSLSKRILYKYGNTPLAMAESAMEFLRMFAQMDFYDIVVSMKASSVKVMYEANKILINKMQKENLNYPLHLGVTEAGNGEDGRIKSICGIGALLSMGIGDTIRVSLTEKPENEIPVALSIASAFKDIYTKDKTNKYNKEEREIRKISLASKKLMDKEQKTLYWKEEETKKQVLQATGIKVFKTEFIACPSCGRTKYDIQEALEKVKQRCSHLAGVKIAVMGCIVNGPGEMADADYGYIGCGQGKVNLYRKAKLVYSSVKEEEALDKLISMIKQDGLWKEKQ